MVGVTVPQAAPVQPVPDNDQLTPWLPASLVTVAAKVAEAPTGRLAVVLESVTVIAGAGVTVIAEAAVLVASVREVAVSVTLAGLGRAVGAV